MTVMLQQVELAEAAFTDVSADKIDRINGIIRGVKILGRHSKNAGGNREYSTAAIQEAARRYEGMEVNLNHPKGNKASVRDLIEGWGVIRNARVGDDGAYGDLHYLKSHPSTPWLLERIERDMQIGLSHNARGTCRINNGREIIESVPVVFSADLVSRPATVKSLFESVNEINEGEEVIKNIAKTRSLPRLINLRGRSFAKPLQEMVVDSAHPQPSTTTRNFTNADTIKQAALAAIEAKLSSADVATLKAVMRALGIPDSISKNVPAGTPVSESHSNSESVRYRLPGGRYVDYPASWGIGKRHDSRTRLKNLSRR